MRNLFITLASVFLFSNQSFAANNRSGKALANSIAGSVWVANEEGNSLTIVNAETNKAIATLTGIEGPHNVQLSSDNKTVWAVSGHKSLAVAIDTATYTLKGTAPTGKMPAHIIVTPNGKSIYVTNGEDNSVSVIDAATMKTVATIPVGKLPHGLRSSPNGKWIFVANNNDTNVSVIETATNIKVADIEVGQKPAQVGFSPDGKFIYVSLNAENAVAKIDVVKRTLLGKTEVGSGPIQVFVSPNGKYLLVANQGTKEKPSTSVSIIATKTFSVIKTVETGKGAHGIVIDPSSRYAYITNIFENSVAVLDLTTMKVVAIVPTGIKPNGISFSSLSPSPAVGGNFAIKLPETKDSDDKNMKH